MNNLFLLKWGYIAVNQVSDKIFAFALIISLHDSDFILSCCGYTMLIDSRVSVYGKLKYIWKPRTYINYSSSGAYAMISWFLNLRYLPQLKIMKKKFNIIFWLRCSIKWHTFNSIYSNLTSKHKIITKKYIIGMQKFPNFSDSLISIIPNKNLCENHSRIGVIVIGLLKKIIFNFWISEFKIDHRTNQKIKNFFK